MRVLLGVFFVVGVAGAQDPLPLGRSSKLKGATYTLVGEQVLRKGVKLLCQKNVHIIGSEQAKLIVQGDLETHGLRGSEVVFQDVDVILDERFQRARLAFAKFRGRAGLFTRPKKFATGKLHMEDVWFEGEAKLKISFHEGLVEIKRTSANALAEIYGHHPDRNLKVVIFWCYAETKLVSGFHGGLRIAKVKEASVRWTRIGGTMARFEDFGTFTLEACKIDSETFSMHQSRKGRFSKTKFLKCDVYTDQLLFNAPPGSKDRVTLDSCYFAGSKPDAKTIKKNRIDETGRVSVTIKKPRKQASNLAGTNRPR